jgi:hypothetical protein
MIFRVNFGFHGISFGAPALSLQNGYGDGFGPLYNAASPVKQATSSRFASAGGGAYLGVATAIGRTS